MKRPPLVAVVLSLALVGGCNSAAKRDKEAQSDQTKMADAQREVRQNPDKFENSDDPPINAETHFAAGQLQESQGDVPGAIKQYRAALKLDPNNKNALYRLGLLQTTQKNYPDALLTWRQYLKVTKNSAEGYNNLALCYEQAGQFADAEKNFKEGIARDPEEHSCRINYGVMLARQGQMQAAADQLATVLPPAEVQYNLGSVLEEQNKKEAAKACYHKALELDPNLSDAKTRLAQMK